MTTTIDSPPSDTRNRTVYTVLAFDSNGRIVEREIDHELLRSIYNDPATAPEIYGFVPDGFPVMIAVEDGLITGFTQLYLP